MEVSTAGTALRAAGAAGRDLSTSGSRGSSMFRSPFAWRLPRVGRQLSTLAAARGPKIPRAFGQERSLLCDLSFLCPLVGVAACHRRRGRLGTSVRLASTMTEAAPPAGEWAFRASVLGCEGALSGHVYLDPNGRAAYLADGVQIVGRGVGHWATNGEMVAVELDVYQYAAAAAVIPEKPHRFRGVFELNGVARGPQQGDWYACPSHEAPRLVGGLDVAADTMELLPLAMAGSAAAGPSPRVPASLRDQAMEALDAQSGLRATAPGTPSSKELLAPYQVGTIPEIYYIPEWISKEEEAEFFQIADGDMRSWEDMRTRSSQEWGAGDRCTCGRGLMRMPLPESQQKLADALHQLGVFDAALYPMNSIRINGYRPGQGIHPHCDGPVYYPKVAILSLGSPCLFSFYPKTGTEDCMKWDPANDVPGGYQGNQSAMNTLFVEPRSLLIFSHDAFWHHRHGIDAAASEDIPSNLVNMEQAAAWGYKPGDRLERARRVSFTMRHLLPRCACQG